MLSFADSLKRLRVTFLADSRSRLKANHVLYINSMWEGKYASLGVRFVSLTLNELNFFVQPAVTFAVLLFLSLVGVLARIWPFLAYRRDTDDDPVVFGMDFISVAIWFPIARSLAAVRGRGMRT